MFHVAPPEQGQTAWTEAVLYSFQGGTDGNEPAARLLMDSEDGSALCMTYLGVVHTELEPFLRLHLPG